MTRYLPRSTPAVLLLVAALFLSAAGGAVAGGKITRAQIKNGAVATKDVKDGSLAPRDLSAAAVGTLTYELEYVVASSAATPVPQNAVTSISAVCPDGTVVIGGAVVFDGPADGTLVGSGPMPGNAVGWEVSVQNDGPASAHHREGPLRQPGLTAREPGLLGAPALSRHRRTTPRVHPTAPLTRIRT